MRISDWSSDVCSSDLAGRAGGDPNRGQWHRDRPSPPPRRPPARRRADPRTRAAADAAITRAPPKKNPFVLSLSKHGSAFLRRKKEQPFHKPTKNGGYNHIPSITDILPYPPPVPTTPSH